MIVVISCTHSQVAVKVFNVDGGSKTVVIEEGMTAAIVCHMLIVKNNCLENPKWSLIEKWEELGIGIITFNVTIKSVTVNAFYGLERVIEDHEIVVDIYSTWPRQNSNTFMFKKLEIKYDLFENPIVSQPILLFIAYIHSNVFRHIFQIICH